jgi:tetratricopeptide (TPR) repeat protein
MKTTLDLCVVRIYSNSGKVIGSGCLVSQKHILTCAHVVTDALGLPRTTLEMPDAHITLDFPLLTTKQLLKAKVVFWRPVNPDIEVEDIAGLELENSLPEMAQPAKLITSDDLWEHPFRVWGFPLGRPNGVSATGVLREQVANGWVQLEDVKQSGYRLEAGFSGAPIWDEKLRGVVGIAVAAEINRLEAKAAFMIPALVLEMAWNKVNVISQELIAKLQEYSSRVEKLVFKSYGRSGQIDQDCKEYLSRARNDLGLSLSDTSTLETNLLLLCQNSLPKVRTNIGIFEENINCFVENKLEEYYELEESEMSDMLDQLKLALGLNKENADKTFSLSISNYGNKLLESDSLKAVVVFKQALSYNPYNIAAHISLGNALLQNSRFLDAIKAFEKVVSRKEDIRKYCSREDINKINYLIQTAKRMYWQEIILKIFRPFSLIPITKIMKRKNK